MRFSVRESHTTVPFPLFATATASISLYRHVNCYHIAALIENFHKGHPKGFWSEIKNQRELILSIGKELGLKDVRESFRPLSLIACYSSLNGITLAVMNS